MAISTITMNQQQQYQQSSSQARKITLLKPAELAESNNTNKAIANKVLATAFTESSQQLMAGFLKQNLVPETTQEADDIIYQRPLPPDINVMVLVLKSFFGEEFLLFDESTLNDNQQQIQSLAVNFNGLSSKQNKLSFTLDGNEYQEQDIVQVEQWFSQSQNLSYQMQGQFMVDDEVLSINYSFTLTSEQTSYRSFETTAGALKDPLLVQFSDRGLGQIKGQTTFDINGDQQADVLPIFSGDVGYLVYDKNDNGQADNGQELFGPKTGNGFAELALLDSNKNGFIDKEDLDFSKLYLWQPSEQQSLNGASGQWLSLEQANIKAINLSAINTPFSFYDDDNIIQAQLIQSSFAISEDNKAQGVFQVDVRI